MKKKILYIVNVDWFFDSHRFDLAKATKNNGFDVHILLNITSEKIVEKFKNAGFSVYPMKSQRGQHGVFSLLEHIYKYWKTMYELKPDVVHFITMKPIILGGLVSRLFNFHSVFAITGLGPAFSDGKGFIAFKRSIFKKLLKLSLCTANEVIVQNEGDKKFIRMLIGDISKTKINLIKGSGVSMEKFFPNKEQKSTCFTIVSSGRFLKQKGFHELVMACKRLRAKGYVFTLSIYGWIDKGNKDHITQNVLDQWRENRHVDKLEKVDDIAPILRGASIFVLASYYGEGLPRSIIEAQASGLPVITTSIPGCIDSIHDGITGDIVPPKDICALEKAIESFILSKEKLEMMSYEARRLAVSEYSIESVIKEHQIIYNRGIK